MNRLIYVLPVILAVATIVGSANAQRRPTKSRTPAKSTNTKARTPATLPPLEVRTAREKVENQLSNVEVFVERLGPIAQAIETLDESSRTKTLPRATVDRNNENKQKVVIAIRNLRAGLADLETEFKTKAALQKYLTTLEGITDLASRSEDSAIAGRFVAAKDPLRDVAQKLRETLATLPYSAAQ